MAMDLYRVPEGRMQQNLDLLEKMLDRSLSNAEIVSAVAEVLPEQNISEPENHEISPLSCCYPSRHSCFPTFKSTCRCCGVIRPH